MLRATLGRGCGHCERGEPIEEVETKGYEVRVCLECCMAWFPGKDTAWWEVHHAPFADHLGDKIRAARERELEAWERWIAGLRSEERVKVGH